MSSSETAQQQQESCKTYSIEHSPPLGKYLVANKPLDKGEVIFTDFPLIYGPKHVIIEDGPFPCVGCCKLLETENEHCPGCFWPVCNVNCKGLIDVDIHATECQILKLRTTHRDNMSLYEYFRFDILIAIRALVLQKTAVEKWQELMKCEDHLDKRMPGTKTFGIIQEKATYIQENFIKPLKAFEDQTGEILLKKSSEDIIHKIYAILEVNAMEITDSIDIEALYPTSLLIEHNCVPNCAQIVDKDDGFKVTVRAAMPIQKGDHLTTSYADITRGTHERLQYLRETKYFTCDCKRCMDPTELGTFFSALVCLGTETEPCNGTQLPDNPTAENFNWVCNKCNLKLPNKDIMKFVAHLGMEVDKQQAKVKKMEDLEDFLNKLLTFLHPHHYLAYSVKHSLAQLYRSADGVELSQGFLNQKLKLCEELIEITKTLDPGNARLGLYLGVLLNEQFQAKFKMLALSFNPEQKESVTSFAVDLKTLVEESKLCLTFERKSSEGAKLYDVICQNETKLTSWLAVNEMVLP